MKEPNAMSFHVKYKPEDFMPANEEEKQSQVIMRESVGFWQDGFRRLRDQHEHGSDHRSLRFQPVQPRSDLADQLDWPENAGRR